MIKNFKKKFGNPENTICVMGDFDKSNNRMKGIEPVICKRFRKLFRNTVMKEPQIRQQWEDFTSKYSHLLDK